MELGRHFLPTEEHHSDERRLHEEGENSLNSQWSAKYVTHKPAVVRPVGTKLKLENDSCGHANGEVHAKERHPELGGGEPFLVASAIIDGLHHTDYYSQS